MANMIPISTITVGSGGASTIELSNIPQIYTDLVLLTSLRNDSTDADAIVTFNTAGGTYAARRLLGLGSGSPISGTQSQTAIRLNVVGQTANTFASGNMYIANYTSSNAKSFYTDSVSENNSPDAVAMLSTNLWSGTSPIVSITLSIGIVGNKFAQYSSATLYGIRKY
jgi:hypothetical protein